jgi:hypothetical protein
MALTYPLTLPSAPGFTRSRLTPRSVVASSASPFTGEQQIFRHQGEWWEIEAGLPPMRRAVAEAWLAALTSLFGKHGTFLFGDPDAKTPLGTFTGAPLVDGGGQTGNTLATKGWTPAITLKAGNYIQLGSGATARLHKLLTDAVTDGAGLATLDIFPRLRTSPANDAAIVTTNCQGVFRLNSAFEWSADQLSNYGISFGGIEAL